MKIGCFLKKNVQARGFTLVELLVVIAIIGILSSIVLVSLNTARSKGKDAKIWSEVGQIKTQIEAGYSNAVYADLKLGTFPENLHVATLDPAGPGYDNLTTLENDILPQMPAGALLDDPSGLIIYSNAISGSPADYGIYASTTSGYFCLDSFGNTNQAGGYTIPSWADIEVAAGTPPTKLCL